MLRDLGKVLILLLFCVTLTACGGFEQSAGESVKGTVSGAAVTKSTKPVKMKGKSANFLDVIFRIKERTEQGYKAEVELKEEEEGEVPFWELYLELEDEIEEISGAQIVSHEGNRYIIRGEGVNRHIPGGESARFDIVVSCPGEIHEPGLCYSTKEAAYLGKDFKSRVQNVKRDGDSVTATLVLTNDCGRRVQGWELGLSANFKITSMSNCEFLDTYEEKGDNWYLICGDESDCNVETGETLEITVTGQYEEEKPEIDIDEMLEQVEAEIDWSYVEGTYGARYGKIDKYLVADSVSGVDLFFVFDEKQKENYTATVELTNIMEEPIADWEIYLECEDSIEEISGAEIVSHEGNRYRIRAKEREKWIPAFGMETFRVKVSCEGEIHHLGKAYLAKAQVRDGEEKQGHRKEFQVSEKEFEQAAGPLWISYKDLYEDKSMEDKDWEKSYDLDDFDTYEEYEAYMERGEWGKKMGR